MSSVASLSVLTCGGLYRVPTRQLVVGDNMLSGFLYSLLGGALLVAANVMMGHF